MADTLALINAANEAQRIAYRGYGYLTQVVGTTNVTIAHGTDTAVLTTPSATFQNNRAFRVTVFGGAGSGGTVDYCLFRLLKTNATGTVYVSQMRVDSVTAGTSNILVNLSMVLVNTSGADITTTLCLTGNGSGAVWTWGANATTSISYMLVEDIGSATVYNGFQMS